MSKALIIVDPQNDFCENGSLAVPNSNQIFSKINALRRKQKFDHVVVTLDWHPADHISFAVNHNEQPFSQKIINGEKFDLWPVHCVENTKGAKPSQLLQLQNNEIYIKKGRQKTVQQYSGFGTESHPTQLQSKLKSLNVNQVTVVGLSFDYCVGSTALDAKKLGFDVTVIKQCTKSVAEQTRKKMIMKLKQKGIKYI